MRETSLELFTYVYWFPMRIDIGSYQRFHIITLVHTAEAEEPSRILKNISQLLITMEKKKNTEIFEKMKHSCPSPPRVKASSFILRCKEVVKKIYARNRHLLQQATTPGNPTVSISIKHIKRIL